MTIFWLGSTRAGEVETAEDSGGARQRERGPEACTRMRRRKHDSLGVCHQLRPAASLNWRQSQDFLKKMEAKALPQSIN
jgi:hypothetical protein